MYVELQYIFTYQTNIEEFSIKLGKYNYSNVMQSDIVYYS